MLIQRNGLAAVGRQHGTPCAASFVDFLGHRATALPGWHCRRSTVIDSAADDCS
jgi:hypothetical protein